VTEDKTDLESGRTYEYGRVKARFEDLAVNAACLNIGFYAHISLDVTDGALMSFRMGDQVRLVDGAITVTRQEAEVIAVRHLGEWLIRKGATVKETRLGYALKEFPQQPPVGTGTLTARPAWKVTFSDINESYAIVGAETGDIFTDGRRG
jgi:hypothetical protein